LGILETTQGHDRVQKVLIQAFLRGQLPSQLLFVGPEGIGKKRVAWGMAELLLCQRLNPEGQACGVCPSCLKIPTGFHESILLVEPEKNLIKLEKAREIQVFLSLSHDDHARIVILDDAHCMNPQSSNSLLKLVEEPPPKTYFFFITHRWAQVLPTIRSRTTKISFSPLSHQDLTRWADPEKEAHLIRLARGSVKQLLDQKHEEASLIRDEAYEVFHQFFSNPQYLMLGAWRDLVKDKDKLILFIRYWLISLQEYIHHKMLHNHQQTLLDSSHSSSPNPSDSLSRPTQSGHQEKSFEEFLKLSPHLKGLLNLRDDVVWSLWERGLTLEAGVFGHRDPVLLLEEWLLTSEITQRKGISHDFMG